MLNFPSRTFGRGKINAGFICHTFAILFTLSVNAAPPFATTQTIMAVSPNTIQLSGMVTPNNLSTGCWFEWGVDTDYGQRTTTVPIGNGRNVVWTTNVLSGLNDGQIYHYRVVATNANGTAYGADQTFSLGKKIWAWGWNYYHQTNIPSGNHRPLSLTSGYAHVLALNEDGTVFSWGNNESAQTNVPPDLPPLRSIGCGWYFNLGVQRDGAVRVWGYTNGGLATIPAAAKSNVVAVTGAFEFAMALRSDGNVVVWGQNENDPLYPPASLSNVVAIAAGELHAVALRDNGTVVAWGNNGYGQTNVPNGLTNVVAISAGGVYTCALKSDGKVVVWGNDSYGATNLPTSLTNVIELGCGNVHAAALRSDNTIVAWGSNSNGETNVPSSITKAACLCSGSEFSAALSDNGAPVCLPQSTYGSVNSDLVVTLAASDPNGDAVTFSITTLPAAGSLYQYTTSGRGPKILSPNTTVLDEGGRVIFVPSLNAFGDNYASFTFNANDAISNSTVDGVVTVTIEAPTGPIYISNASISSGCRCFRMLFYGTPNAGYTVWASTNLVDWSSIGRPDELLPGFFEFEDVGMPTRFYQVRWP